MLAILQPHQQLLLGGNAGPFDFHQLDCLCGDVFGADFELLDQFPGSAGVAEPVFYPDCAGDDGYTVEQMAFP